MKLIIIHYQILSIRYKLKKRKPVFKVLLSNLSSNFADSGHKNLYKEKKLGKEIKDGNKRGK